jgi:chromosomal replication initiator protein
VYKQALRKQLENFFSFSELERWFDPLDIRPGREKGVLHVAFPHIFFRRHFINHIQGAFERALLSLGVSGVFYEEHHSSDESSGMHLVAPCILQSSDVPGNSDEQNWQANPAYIPANETSDKDRISCDNGKQSGKSSDNTAHKTTSLLKHYTFENFLFNGKNDLPVAAARDAADILSAGGTPPYNPFIVYGLSGSGKSHLLGAMAHVLKKSGLSVFYGNIMTFPALLETAPGYCPDTDKACMFLDDAQRAAACIDMQNALVALMDLCLSSGRLLALSFDRHPSTCPELGQKLLSRIAAGLVVELKRPDLDVRLIYAEKHTAELKLDLNKEQILSLAGRNTDIRSIDGYMARLTAYRSMTKKNGLQSSARDAYTALSLKETERSRLTPDLIIAVVAEHFSISAEEIISKMRDRKSSLARNTAIFLCRDLLNLSLVGIGSFFGKRDHTSILYSIKKIRKLCESDKDTNKLVGELKKMCLNRR